MTATACSRHWSKYRRTCVSSNDLVVPSHQGHHKQSLIVPLAALLLACRSLGADGVMVPLVNGKADAEQAVSYCLFPPQGQRSAAYPVRCEQYMTLPPGRASPDHFGVSACPPPRCMCHTANKDASRPPLVQQ
jgi:hypothetical protein